MYVAESTDAPVVFTIFNWWVFTIEDDIVPDDVILVTCNAFQNLALLPKFKVPLVDGIKLAVCWAIEALSADKLSILAVPSINKSLNSFPVAPKL